MSEIDPEASSVRRNALLEKPLFSGPPDRDYVRQKLSFEVIFSVLFPQWGRTATRSLCVRGIEIHVSPSIPDFAMGCKENESGQWILFSSFREAWDQLETKMIQVGLRNL
jgi:hypothetical protein